ncbi:MAG: biopolymer transporter ExbD [Campylobacter sp.]|nr:biopolymer transporter ExbD [Campylobacter sp.]
MMHRDNTAELSEINVTPFIDIMLVLLIIFMAVAPLLTSSIKIELPRAGANALSDRQKLLIITISKDEIALNSKAINLQNLANVLEVECAGDKERTIYLHIDKAVEYERIVAVMQILKHENFEKIALSTQIRE